MNELHPIVAPALTATADIGAWTPANAAEYAGAVQSANYRSRGAMSVFEGRQQANAAGYKGAASLIAGAGSLAQTGAQAYGVYDKYKIPRSSSAGPTYTNQGS